MSELQNLRSPKVQMGGLCHLGRLIDKIQLRHAGKIQDYNYLTVGFDKYLLDFLEIKGEDLEKRVLQGGKEEEWVDWVMNNGKSLTEEDRAQWNSMVLNGVPNNEQAQQRFDALIESIAEKRGVSIGSLPQVKKWVDAIDLDEGRL